MTLRGASMQGGTRNLHEHPQCRQTRGCKDRYGPVSSIKDGGRTALAEVRSSLQPPQMDPHRRLALRP